MKETKKTIHKLQQVIDTETDLPVYNKNSKKIASILKTRENFILSFQIFTIVYIITLL